MHQQDSSSSIDPSPIEEDFPTSDQSWDLDSLYEGGADSEDFESLVDNVLALLEVLEPRVESLPALGDFESPEDVGLEEALDRWAQLLDDLQKAGSLLHEARSFARCVAAASADDRAAQMMPVRVNQHVSRLEGMKVTLRAKLREVESAVFEVLLEHPRLEDMQLHVREMRRKAAESMEPELEGLAVELNRDGLHAWGQLYDQVSGSLQVEVGAVGERDARTMSVGQAKNLMSDDDREVRRTAFEGLREAWGGEATTLATALNSIVGTQQTLYERRGVDELSEPLRNNRIERDTLEALMEGAASMRGPLREYLEMKADALRVDGLEWYDLRAPVGRTDGEGLDWEEAQEFIVEQIDDFSEPMGRFYRHALVNQWVEAEDRAGKAQGGFCSTLAASREIRIFMTYGGSMTNVLTLAHELGHGWHGWVMRDLPPVARHIPMTLAESASTLSEKLVEAAAFERAGAERELHLLDERLQRATSFLLDIPARFQLERAMHRERRNGQLGPELLGELTRNAFRDSFGDALASIDERFWASKLHYYITRYPFYNFPYTFGYLFSKALYDRSLEAEEDYAETVDALLVDSGRYTAEELAERYLGADLGDADFWREAASSIEADVGRYRELTTGA